MSYRFVKDYKNHESLRKSFAELGRKTFGIDFERWYQAGCWNDRYMCYSYELDGSIVSNVSVNYMELVIGGRLHKAVQIGTVMTDEAHRNKGLAYSLMEKAVADHKDKCDFIYLFGNDSAINLYKKFGLTEAYEKKYLVETAKDIESSDANSYSLRKMDIGTEYDLDLFMRVTSSRKPVSNTFGAVNDEALTRFYGILGLSDDMYYIEEADAIVYMEKDGDTTDLVDVITAGSLDMDRLIATLSSSGSNKISFHFTVESDIYDIKKETLTVEDSTLLTSGVLYDLGDFRFPATSHA